MSTEWSDCNFFSAQLSLILVPAIAMTFVMKIVSLITLNNHDEKSPSNSFAEKVK